MDARVLGIETEYGFSALGRRATALDKGTAVSWLMDLAKRRLPHLSDRYSSSGIFLQNGARLYIDHGAHPEFCTPECHNPSDIVRYILAGEKMLASLAAELPNTHRDVSDAMFFKANVDYSGISSTWGCHESYLHRADPSILPQQIIPHLASRIIYTGAGGFNPLYQGVEFTISPRVWHLVTEVSDNSTCQRGLFHTKDESLCRSGYHRLHILCGESLCSELGMWLKVGTTALVVAMIEAGLCPGDEVALRAPLKAMRTFAADPSCRAVAESISGDERSAITIQRHYLDLAETHIDDAWMPQWAEEVCRQWQAMLERLEDAPESVSTSLDWAIKHTLYEDRIRRRGIDMESIPHWNAVVKKLCRALDKAHYEGNAVSVEVILSSNSPIADEVKRQTSFIQKKDLTWEGFNPFLALRQELCEVDWRFGQLGEKSIFAAMDRAGVLTHHVPGVDEIEQAMADPPAVGRARLRGECVRRFTGQDGVYWCDWQAVCDCQAGRVLDLSDPFETEERWQARPQGDEDKERPGPPFRLRDLLNRIL